MSLVPFLVSTLCLWIAGKFFYNLYLHPLRSYPGPWLCRASSLPRVWHRIAGTNIGHAHDAHEKYGYVVRLSPTELSYINSDAWDDIYARQGGHEALPKEPVFNSAPPDFPRGLVQALDGPDHSRQRRIFAPAFTNMALKKQESMILGHVQKLVANLRQACESGKTQLNIADQFNFLTFDVMADLSFGKPLGLLDAGEYSPWVRNIFAVFSMLAMRVAIMFYLPQVWRLIVPLLSTKSNVQKRMAHIKYASDLVDQHLDHETHNPRPDIWSLVEKKKDLLTRSEMHINAAIFMAAGTETTATSLCGAMWYLTKDRSKMDILTREVRNVAHEELTMQTLAALPYLNAVVNETFRLYPPVPDMLYRLVPEGGATIAGKHVPAGAVVGLHQWPAYHSTRNFTRPEEFIPERWLPEGAEGEFANDQRKAVQVFSKGSRSCIGKKYASLSLKPNVAKKRSLAIDMMNSLAMHEIRLALVCILRQFDFFATEESKEWIHQKSFIVWEKPPLLVQVKTVS